MRRGLLPGMMHFMEHTPTTQSARPFVSRALVGLAVVFVSLIVQAIGFVVGLAVISGSDPGILDGLDKAGAPARAIGVILVAELVLAGVATFVFYAVRYHPSAASVERHRPPYRAFAVLVALLLGSQLIAVSTEGGIQEMGASRILLWLGLAIIIGWAEEVIFRGVVHQVIGGFGLATVIVSAVLFGLPHVASFGAGGAELFANAFTVAMVVGVPFAALRERGLGLVPLVFLHGAVDMLAFMGTDSLGVQAAPNNELLIQCGIVAVIGGCWLLWFAKTQHMVPAPSASPGSGPAPM